MSELDTLSVKYPGPITIADAECSGSSNKVADPCPHCEHDHARGVECEVWTDVATKAGYYAHYCGCKRMSITWAEFKRRIEAEGVKDEDEIDYIDIGAYDTFSVSRTSDGSFSAS